VTIFDQQISRNRTIWKVIQWPVISSILSSHLTHNKLKLSCLDTIFQEYYLFSSADSLHWYMVRYHFLFIILNKMSSCDSFKFCEHNLLFLLSVIYIILFCYTNSAFCLHLFDCRFCWARASNAYLLLLSWAKNVIYDESVLCWQLETVHVFWEPVEVLARHVVECVDHLVLLYISTVS
jgi:hypothetical protein